MSSLELGAQILDTPSPDAPSGGSVDAGRSRRREVFSMILRSWSGRIGLTIALLIIGMAVFAPLIAPYEASRVFSGEGLRGPCIHWLGCDSDQTQHLMGTDRNGRDIFSRVVFGSRISLLAGAAAVATSVIAGTLIGLIAGFYGRFIDNLLMRIMDLVMSFPALLLAIFIVTVRGRGMFNAILAISIVAIPAYARVVRAQVLAVKGQDFITADKALGVSNMRLLFHRVLPNSITPLIVQATLGFATAVLEIAGLGFLGLGVQAPNPEWGTMISDGFGDFNKAINVVLFPGLMIFFNVLAFNLLGDALRDALDPRSARRG